MMRAAQLALSPKDRDHLHDWLRGPAPAGTSATRIRIVLLAAEGWLNVEIATELAISVNTVTTWRGRFAAAGIDGLVDRPRSGRPRSVDRAAIIAATLRPPRAAGGRRRWSCRELGTHLGVGEATVARVWREYGLAPREAGAFAFATQPELTARRVDVIGVYLTPQTRAVALLVDRPAPTNDRGPVAPIRTPVGARTPGPTRFLEQVLHAYPHQQIHLVVDNAAAARRLMIGNAASVTGDVVLHFTLGTEIWLNLLEVWSVLTARDPAEAIGTGQAVRIRALDESGARTVWVRSKPDQLYDDGPFCEEDLFSEEGRFSAEGRFSEEGRFCEEGVG